MLCRGPGVQTRLGVAGAAGAGWLEERERGKRAGQEARRGQSLAVLARTFLLSVMETHWRILSKKCDKK